MKPRRFLFIWILVAGSLFGAMTYFPKGAITDFEQEWYANHLSAMKEPVLALKDGDKSYFAFRVLYLPTWGRPVAFRIENNGERVAYRATMLSGDGGYDPGKIKEEKTGELTPKEFTSFLSDLRKSGLWELSPKDKVIGADGSQLVIEAIQDGRHVVLVRWTPEEDTAKRQLTELVELYTKLFQGAKFWSKE